MVDAMWEFTDMTDDPGAKPQREHEQDKLPPFRVPTHFPDGTAIRWYHRANWGLDASTWRSAKYLVAALLAVVLLSTILNDQYEAGYRQARQEIAEQAGLGCLERTPSSLR